MRIAFNKSELKGTVRAPSSKSYTIRGLMCAALAGGRSELKDPLSSDDTEAALQVLARIGVKTTLNSNSWQVSGGDFHTPGDDLFCGESAATLRFMTAIGSLVPGGCRLTAGPSLSKRPVNTLVEALNKWGIKVSCRGEYAPVEIAGGQLNGGLTALRGDISSQYVSALLLVAPRCLHRSQIRLTTPLESRPYVLMTLECLRKFGIQVKASDDLGEYEIWPQTYASASYEVEGDWSSASYLMALGAIAGEMRITNLNQQTLQGDKAIIDLLKMMGAGVDTAGEHIIIKKEQLKAIKADLNDCIDLLPTLAVLAALAEGVSEFTGIRRARLKESNRVASMREGLKRAGIEVTEYQDKLIIKGGKPHNAVIDSKNDHRIAMAFSLMGIASGGITLEGAECVSKTYPEYWDILSKLGVKMNEQ
jgi:3-phosphoshikimate 1-carboxyvinyltransferase